MGRPSRTLRSALCAALLAALSTGAFPRGAAAADLFYLGLLADGTQAYDRGDFATAARQLRIACFGLLDEPEALGSCLVRLALAQGQSGDEEGFRETFRRTTEVEDRFQGYTRADLPPALRAAFEQRVAAKVPETTLATLPAFRGLLAQQLDRRIEAMPPKQRRAELEKRIAAEPRDPRWPVMLGRLDLAEGRPAAALARAQSALAAAPADPRALCLRGLAQARSGRCREAVADLEGCAQSTRDAEHASALLGCHLDLGDTAKAEALLAALPETLRADREIARLARRPPKPRPGAADPTPRTGAAEPPPEAPPLPATGGLAAKDRATLEQVRALLAGEAPARDLKRALQLAREVADANKTAKEAQLLAAEAAYRNSRWDDAAGYFRRAGDPGDDQPEVLFYMAVSYFESGDKNAAAASLRRSLPNLQRTPFVDRYAKKILGETARP